MPRALFDVWGMAGIVWVAGEVRDPERVRDAAADDRLGLDDVDRAPPEQLDGGAAGLEDLAAGERDVEGGPEICS